MAFIRKLFDSALLPETKGQKVYILSPSTLYLIANHVYRIDLGLWMPYLPTKHILHFVDIHPKFSILNKYAAHSCDELRLLVLVTHTLIIEPNTPLCEVLEMPVSSLIPGTSNFLKPYHYINRTLVIISFLCH
jgi:hypothetical protein